MIAGRRRYLRVGRRRRGPCSARRLVPKTDVGAPDPGAAGAALSRCALLRPDPRAAAQGSCGSTTSAAARSRCAAAAAANRGCEGDAGGGGGAGRTYPGPSRGQGARSSTTAGEPRRHSACAQARSRARFTATLPLPSARAIAGRFWRIAGARSRRRRAAAGRRAAARGSARSTRRTPARTRPPAGASAARTRSSTPAAAGRRRRAPARSATRSCRRAHAAGGSSLPWAPAAPCRVRAERVRGEVRGGRRGAVVGDGGRRRGREGVHRGAPKGSDDDAMAAISAASSASKGGATEDADDEGGRRRSAPSDESESFPGESGPKKASTSPVDIFSWATALRSRPRAIDHHPLPRSGRCRPATWAPPRLEGEEEKERSARHRRTEASLRYLRCVLCPPSRRSWPSRPRRSPRRRRPPPRRSASRTGSTRC